jgi:flagellar biosynthesis/type III secretory pathway chaperone
MREVRHAVMINTVKELIEALRDELKNYGEMLVLLDRQQEYLTTRAADEVFHSINLIQAHGSIIQEARERREGCRRTVAEAAGRAGQASFSELIPLLPADYQPLLKALVDENNELLYRVRRRARQNHLMLKRAVELMQQVLNSLCPTTRASAGDGQGRLNSRTRPTRRLFEGIN